MGERLKRLRTSKNTSQKFNGVLHQVSIRLSCLMGLRIVPIAPASLAKVLLPCPLFVRAGGAIFVWEA